MQLLCKTIPTPTSIHALTSSTHSSCFHSTSTSYTLFFTMHKSICNFFQFLLQSAPYNNFIEMQDLNVDAMLEAEEDDPSGLYLKEALGTTEPDTFSLPLQNLAASRPAFLSFSLSQLYQNHCTIPFPSLTQTSSKVQNCTFEHPEWPKRKWNAIWESKPFVLDPIVIPAPTVEETIHGVLLRIHLTAEHLPAQCPQFEQGTIVTFKGDYTSDVRYVVEWCKLIKGNNAYLKVVATGKNRYPYPFNDPQYPAFLLIVPSYLSLVKFQSPIHLTLSQD
jgi:hypothetical protein